MAKPSRHAEVLEEEELAAIRQRQEDFEQTRNAELAEVQRPRQRRGEIRGEGTSHDPGAGTDRKGSRCEKRSLQGHSQRTIVRLARKRARNARRMGNSTILSRRRLRIYSPWVDESVAAELEKVALSSARRSCPEAAVKRGQEQTEKGSSTGVLRAAEAAAKAKRQVEIDAQ